MVSDRPTGSAPPPVPMQDDEVVRIIDKWAEDAINEDEDELSERREKIIGRYRMEPYGDEEDGYSKIVTGEVLEVVEWALPSIIRTFLAGMPIKFQGIGSGDTETADRETRVVNWVIRHQNDAFPELMTWFKDALLFPNSYLKVWWDDRIESSFEDYEGVTDEQYQGLVASGDPIVSQEPEDIEVMVESLVPDPQTGQPMPAMVPSIQTIWSLTLRVDKHESRLMFKAVPPEEVLIASNCTSLDLDEADFVVHEPVDVTRSDLMAMGYDYDTVMTIPLKDDDLGSTERTSRRSTTDENSGLLDPVEVKMMERVDYKEAYGRMDVDGDGYAEYRKICKVGQTVLRNEYADGQPFCCLTAIPQPHRHVGMGLAELAEPLQRISSAMFRQGNDNLYRVNRPRAILGESIDSGAWQDYEPHGAIDGNPSDYAPEVVPVAVQHILPWMNHLNDELQSRTGISKHAMGLDSEAMAQSTMGAYLEAAGASSQRLEMLIRTFAETGMSQFARKVHELLRKHQDAELEVEINGEWQSVDPREWKKRTNIVPTVGIGTGSMRERAAAAQTIMGLQTQLQPMGLATPRQMYQAAADLVTALGRHDTESYVLNPDTPEGQQVQMQMAQGQQAQQQQMQQMMAAQLQDMERRFMLEMQKIQQKADAQAQENERKWAEMELKTANDIIDRGIEASQVVPMPGVQPQAAGTSLFRRS